MLCEALGAEGREDEDLAQLLVEEALERRGWVKVEGKEGREEWVIENTRERVKMEIWKGEGEGRKGRGISTREIERRVGISRSSARRILTDLEWEGEIERVGTGNETKYVKRGGEGAENE